MKSIKLLFTIIFTGALLSSCTSYEGDRFADEISLEEIVSGYDLWYIDYNKTSGNGDIPFLSKAFTISFLNGRMYANNNIVDIGKTGNGLGIIVGNYNTFNGFLETRHNLDGRYDFDITQISANEIRIRDNFENVSYYLVGYQRNKFDYDKLFYENIEYFLQEYVAWEKAETIGGNPNAFDNENFLQFTPENITTFYSSQDNIGTNIDYLKWDYIGNYQVFDVVGYENLKILDLIYDGGDVEEFELKVLTGNDNRIELYHINSNTTYNFYGRGFVRYLKGGKQQAIEKNRNSDRKRIKVEREEKTRRVLK